MERPIFRLKGSASQPVLLHNCLSLSAKMNEGIAATLEETDIFFLEPHFNLASGLVVGYKLPPGSPWFLLTSGDPLDPSTRLGGFHDHQPWHLSGALAGDELVGAVK